MGKWITSIIAWLQIVAVGLVFNLDTGYNKNSPEGYSRLSSVARPAGVEISLTI
jgi:hypothetical protein